METAPFHEHELESQTASFHATSNREELTRSEVCGCYHCLELFFPEEIAEYVDEEQTALCPHCGVDSVVGSASGLPMDRDFLLRVRRRFFC